MREKVIGARNNILRSNHAGEADPALSMHMYWKNFQLPIVLRYTGTPTVYSHTCMSSRVVRTSTTRRVWTLIHAKPI